MRPDPLEELRLAARRPIDRRQHEARGVEDRPESADPGQVVVARPEEGEQGIGDVRVEDLDRPVLPLPEQVRELVDKTEQRVGLEKRDRRWGSAGRGLERDDASLAPLIRAEQREQERHDERDGAEARDRGDRREDPGSGAARRRSPRTRV